MRPGFGRVATSTAIMLALGACSGSPPSTPIARSSLEGAVARVGDVAIPPSLIESVAQAQRLSARGALDGLVADALAAQAAQTAGFDRDPTVAWQREAAVARGIPTHFIAEAAAVGPPSDDELALVSVVHAVVLRSPTLAEDDAVAIATAIRSAAVGARSPEDFEARAGAVSHRHAKVTVERVGPFAADGRGPDGAAFDMSFVAAAFELHTPLETTPVVVTPFGWHVIQLVERAKPQGDLTEQRRDMAEAVVHTRAQARLDALLRKRALTAPVVVSVDADDLMVAATAQP